MFRLDENVVVLIGGNGVLGRNFAEALLKQGGIVHSCDIHHADDNRMKELQKTYRETFHTHTVDCSKKGEIRALKKNVVEKEGRVDVLINSTTMKGNDFYLPFEDVSVEGWNIGLMGNLTIPFLTIQEFIPIMAKQQNGSVINIASLYGIVGNDQRIYAGSNLDEVYVENPEKAKQAHSHGVYNAAKGGLIAFTRYLAAYYGKDNVRVNCISPGGVSNEKENAEFVKKYSERVPLGRKARPDEINGAVVFLASDASSYVTGHNLVVDGGYTTW